MLQIQSVDSGGNSRYVGLNSLMPVSLCVSLNWRVPVPFNYYFFVSVSNFGPTSTGEIYSQLGTELRICLEVLLQPGLLMRSLMAPYVFLRWYHPALDTMHFHLGLGRPCPMYQSPNWGSRPGSPIGSLPGMGEPLLSLASRLQPLLSLASRLQPL